MSNIVILTGSTRKNGNTNTLAQAFAEGAAHNNHVDIISVTDYNVNSCLGCNSCFKCENNKCSIDDDMQVIYERLAQADILVIASPVYFYGISAQLKAIVDRLHTPLRNRFKIKKMALLLVAGAELPTVFDAIKVQYQLILNYFNLVDAGSVLVKGVRHIGDIDKHPALQEAYELGASLL